ncbi:MAG: leucine-rich repeat domain-containing protein [Clostridia bacterium]|nr:leucine-rich repeat domain-containing protein [Clostridia bacterium]
MENAEGYEISVENGENYETENTRLNMQFLEPGETYTVSVKAKGGNEKSGKYFLDSDTTEIICDMPEPFDEFTYTLINGGTSYEVSAGEKITSDTLILPTYHEDGLPITRIAEDAFGESGISAVRFPQKLESIGGRAFSKNDLQEAIFPLSLRSIEILAFSQCKNLKNIENLPNRIDQRSFIVTAIEELIIPERTEYIGDEAFATCDSLAKITIPAEPPDLGCDVFKDTPWYEAQPNGFIYFGKTLYRHKGDFVKDTQLDLSELPINKIADGAFLNCLGLSKVKIPAEIQLGKDVFHSCEDLIEVQFAKDVTYIPERTFFGCSNLLKVEFPEELTEIGADAFYGMGANRFIALGKGALKLVLPKTVTKIGRDSFCYAYISEIVLSENLTSLDASFTYCSFVKWIVIPDNIMSLDGTFYNCTGLRWAILPKNLKVLSASTFENTRLKKIYIKGTQEECVEWLNDNAETMQAFIEEQEITVYAYSEEPPTEEGDFWHYDTDGVTPIPWE